MENSYKDMLDMEYPAKGPLIFGHPRMMNSDRAKIFAPFAALKGFEEKIEETGKEHIQSVETETERGNFC